MTIRIPHDAWVLVGDGEKALIFRNEGDQDYPNFETLRILEQDNPATHDQGSEPPGRYHDGPSVQRSAVQQTDWHRLGKERFANDIAERLYQAAHRNQFRQIIIVAPPMILGELRANFHKEVADRVIGEIPKTLTNHPVYEIEKLIKAT